MFQVSCCDVRDKTGYVPSYSSSNCFVALVKDSNLRDDTLYLPQDFTSRNGFRRAMREIILTDERASSWALKLKFKTSSNAFYISRGWRNFCDETGTEAGGFFVFKLLEDGEIPVLSCCLSKETVNNGTKEDKNNNYSAAASQNPNRIVTLTYSYDSHKRGRLYLPLRFLEANGISAPEVITFVGKDGTKRAVNHLLEAKGRMVLGKGWIDFARANQIHMGCSFTLESIGKEGCSMIRLLHLVPSNKRKLAPTTEPRRTDASSNIHNRFMTFTLTRESVKACELRMPSNYMRANGVYGIGKITLLGTHNMEWCGYLLTRDGSVAVGIGWKNFCEANGVLLGMSFTLEFIEQDDTSYVFKFWPGKHMLSVSFHENVSDE